MGRRKQKKQQTLPTNPQEGVSQIASAEVLRERLGVLVGQFQVQQRNLRLTSEILGQVVGPVRLLLEQIHKDLGKKDLDGTKRLRLSREATALLVGVNRQMDRVLRHVPDPTDKAPEEPEEATTRPPVVRVKEAEAPPKPKAPPNQEIHSRTGEVRDVRHQD